jgi:pyrimidine dimer DNA glycosylase
MQTFLPYAGFERTARALDLRRLGKQRVEALQILRGQTVPGYGWRHHPAVKMWHDHEEALAAYGVAICREWIRRGHADTVLDTLVRTLGRAPRSQAELRKLGLLPAWLGSRAFHRAHRSALVRKDPAWYGPMFPDVPDDLPYVWPPSPRPS